MLVVGVIFPKIPTIFPNDGKNEFFFIRKRGMIFSFSLLLALVSFFFLLFPKKCPIFPKYVGFSGELWERDCFALFSAVLLQRRRNKTTLKWFGALENLFVQLYNMYTQIMRVVQQGEAFAVQSQKSENGQMMKCNIVLQEMGGKYENQYAAAMLGNMAQCKYAPGELVAVTLRFTTHEHNGQVYQDILVTDIEKVKG